MAISPYCIPCEKNNCWIEIDVRDEQNRSFKGQKATIYRRHSCQPSTVMLNHGNGQNVATVTNYQYFSVN